MGPPSLVSKFQLIQGPTSYIEKVSSVKLLGVRLDADSSWKSHVEDILAEATQRLYFLVFKVIKPCGRPPGPATTFLSHSNTSNSRICGPSLAPPTY